MIINYTIQLKLYSKEKMENKKEKGSVFFS